MHTLELMREKLALLQPESLEIIDESERHAGHAGAKSGGGHYRLNIVSPVFCGMGTLERHRHVYAALGELMRERIHALAIHAHCPSEISGRGI
ncbi:MAG: BolA family transcriptional regulator [Betaproteobacteria bacterium]|nr:BolA family transcriptional regulator [Betaproteobacteria bacterium]